MNFYVAMCSYKAQPFLQNSCYKYKCAVSFNRMQREVDWTFF